MKTLLLISLINFWFISYGQNQNQKYHFEKVKIIALDTTYYMESTSDYPNLYFVLLEILGHHYDSTTFCRRRFVASYSAKFCDLKENSIYEITLDKTIIEPDKKALILNYQGLLDRSIKDIIPCYDPIFYLNEKIGYLIIEHKLL